MNYTQEEFLDLMREVEEQGGTALDHDCVPSSYRLKKSPDGPERVVFTQGCDNPALFDIPYPLDDGGAEVTEGTIRVCAVCDNVGMWPRFEESETL